MRKPINLQTTSDPGPERSVVFRVGEGTVVFRGPGADLPAHVCGSCSAPLLVGIDGHYVIDLVLRCNGCGAFNESPGGDGSALYGTHILGPAVHPPGRARVSAEIVLGAHNLAIGSQRAFDAVSLEPTSDSALDNQTANDINAWLFGPNPESKKQA